MRLKDKLPLSYLLFTTRGRIPRSTYWLVSAFIRSTFYVLHTLLRNFVGESKSNYRVKNLLYLLSLLTLLACSEKKTATQETASGQTQVKPNAGPEPPIAPSSDKPTLSRTNAGKWLYEKTVDQEGQPIYKASTISPTLLQFDFPYAGGSMATLTIRKRDSGTHVYIQMSKGQFNRSFQGGKARIRFDGNAAITYGVSAAENGSANIIFFDQEQVLINKMKRARNIVVDIEFAGQGSRQIEFQTAGLTWNH